jgi:uncharacterized protein
VKTRRLIELLAISTACLACGCRAKLAEKPPTALTIATGSTDGIYYQFGKALAATYSRLAGVHAVAEVRESSVRNLEEIEKGTADLTLDGAGHAYQAYTQGTEFDSHPHTRLRAIAVLFSTSVHIAARRDSGIRRVEDFRGKRIAVGQPGGLTDEASQLILQIHGLNHGDIVQEHRSGRDLIKGIRDRSIDGFFLYSPLRPAVLNELSASGEIELVPIARKKITDIQARSPFLLKTVVIPAGTYSGQHAEIATVGADILLICRQDLPERLVLDLTRALYASLPELADAHPVVAEINADRGPLASIPLHPGAARYYRERELLR